MKRLFLLFVSLLLLAAFAACRDNAEVQAEEMPTPAPTDTPAPEPAEPPEEPDELEPDEDYADDDFVAEQDEEDFESQIIGEWYMISSNNPTSVRLLENGIRMEEHYFANGYGIHKWYSPDSGLHEVIRFTWSIRNDFLSQTMIDLNFEVMSDYLGEDYATGMKSMLGQNVMQRFHVEDDILTLVFAHLTTKYQRRNYIS